MRLLKLILLFLLLLIVVFFVKNAFFNSKQLSFGEQITYPIDTAAVHHLSEAIKIATISCEEQPTDTAAFQTLVQFLFCSYPDVKNELNPLIINHNSLLLHWKGKGTSKNPVILYAHMDVVPADTSWLFPAFEGKFDATYIYGRGVIDDKGAVISIFESIHRQLQKKFTPNRDLWFAFGHDEEISGLNGAKMIADHLSSIGVKADYMLDEGGIIAEGMVPFVKRPVALVATSEKGYVTLEFSVKSDGGHSSMPPPNPPGEVLANAINELHQHPFPTKMTPSLDDFMDYAGPEMKMPFRLLFANRWLFQPVIMNQYEQIPGANAMIRTTGVTTILSGGIKENAIPIEVKALINFRIIPGENAATVLVKVRKLIKDPRVTILQHGVSDEPSSYTTPESEGFKVIQRVLHKVMPDVAIAPTISTGGTDSKHFRAVTEHVYRFLPVRMNAEILDGMHGRNEKMKISSFMEMIQFYSEFISAN